MMPLQTIYENLLWNEDVSQKCPSPMIRVGGRVTFPRYFGPGLSSCPDIEPTERAMSTRIRERESGRHSRVTLWSQNTSKNVFGQVRDALRVHSSPAPIELLSVDGETSDESSSVDGDTADEDVEATLNRDHISEMSIMSQSTWLTALGHRNDMSIMSR